MHRGVNLAHPQVGVLIIGAGPTGLGAATRLHQLGYDNFLLIDKVLDRCHCELRAAARLGAYMSRWL